MDRKIEPRSLLVGHVVILTVLCVLVFGKSLSNEFVWDDYLNIVNNTLITSWQNIDDVFSADKYLTSSNQITHVGKGDYGSGEASYRPIVTLSYMFDYAYWKLDSFGYHLTNLILHILVVFSVYQLIYLLMLNPRWALLGSLIFALHPVQSEAVMVASFREDILAALFYLTAFIAYIRIKDFEGLIKLRYSLLTWLAYGCALFSKEMAVTYLLMIVCYDWYFGGVRSYRKLFRKIRTSYLGYIGITWFYFWVWTGPMARTYNDLVVYPGDSFWVNILTMVKVVGTYLSWILFALNIQPTIPDETFWVTSLTQPHFLLSVIAVGGLLYAIYRLSRKRKYVAFGLCWFCIALIPVLNIVPIYNIMAARYLYLPMVGFSIFVVGLIKQVISARKGIFKQVTKDVVVSYGVLVLVFYGLQTVSYGYTFRNELAFRKAVVEYYPNNYRAYKSLSVAYLKWNDLDKVIMSLEKVKELKPDDFSNYVDIAGLYASTNRVDEAISELQIIPQLAPHHLAGYNMLCSLYGQKGKYKTSVRCFRDFIDYNPYSPLGYYNLGVTYISMGLTDQARNAWTHVLSIDSNFENTKELMLEHGMLINFSSQ